jgi:hypothetical protein
MLGWDQCNFPKKRTGLNYTELVFLHLVGYAGHVVHLGLETLTHYFSSLGGTGMDMTKIMPGHVTPNLCFYIWWDLWVTYCILVRLGHEASTHYFSCSSGTGMDMTKRALSHVMPNF